MKKPTSPRVGGPFHVSELLPVVVAAIPNQSAPLADAQPAELLAGKPGAVHKAHR